LGHLSLWLWQTEISERRCPSRDNLKSIISLIFTEITTTTVLSAFVVWIKQLESVIKHQGEDFHNETETDRK
jgi:hypothetical protein